MATINPAIVNVPGAPDGIVRLFVPDGIDVSKSELRQAAAKIAHTIDVGRTPAPEPATFTTASGAKVKGHGYNFAPVKRSHADEAPAETVTAAPAEDPRVKTLRDLGLTDEQITTALAVAAAPGKGKGKSSAFRDKIAARAQLREEQAAVCDKCLGFGKIRRNPRVQKPGQSKAPRYPWAFRTQQGANSAPTGVPCDKCGGQSQAV